MDRETRVLYLNVSAHFIDPFGLINTGNMIITKQYILFEYEQR